MELRKLKPLHEKWHADVMEFLRKFNEARQADEDKIVGIGIVTVDQHGQLQTTYDHKGQGFELIAACEFLKRRIMDDIQEGEG